MTASVTSAHSGAGALANLVLRHRMSTCLPLIGNGDSMPGRQQYARGVELFLCKRAQLEAAHTPTVTSLRCDCEERDVTPGGSARSR